jgi:hypothetical protein
VQAGHWLCGPAAPAVESAPAAAAAAAAVSCQRRVLQVATWDDGYALHKVWRLEELVDDFIGALLRAVPDLQDGSMPRQQQQDGWLQRGQVAATAAAQTSRGNAKQRTAECLLFVGSSYLL